MDKYLWKQGSGAQRMKLSVFSASLNPRQEWIFWRCRCWHYLANILQMLLYSSDTFLHKFSIILYFLLNSREQTERLFGLESFQGMKENYTQSNSGITIIISIIIIISTLRIRSCIKQQQKKKKMVFRIETWHQVLSAAAAILHTYLTAGLVLLFLTDYILLDFWRVFTS